MKFSVFAKTIQKCDTVLRSYSICLTDILISENKNISDDIVNLFLGIVGLQVREKKNVIFCLDFINNT